VSRKRYYRANPLYRNYVDNLKGRGCRFSFEEYQAFTKRKPRRCEACGIVKKLVLDHDHTTGWLRGWCRALELAVTLAGASAGSTGSGLLDSILAQ
jgi:hypothetical protein